MKTCVLNVFAASKKLFSCGARAATKAEPGCTTGEVFISGGFAALMCGEPLAHRDDALSFAATPLSGGAAATEKEKRRRKGRAFPHIKAAKPQKENENKLASSATDRRTSLCRLWSLPAGLFSQFALSQIGVISILVIVTTVGQAQVPLPMLKDNPKPMEANASDSARTGSKFSYLEYLSVEDGLSIDELVKRALADNKALQAERLRLAEAQGRLNQAGLRPNPVISASRTEVTGMSDNATTLGISKDLELNGRRARRIEIAQKEIDVVTAEIANKERMLAFELRARYGEALAAVRKLEIIERILEVQKKNYSLVRARSDEGAVAPLEANRMLVESKKIEAQQASLHSRANVLMLDLKRLAGLQMDTPLKIKDQFDGSEAPVMDQKEAIRLALSARSGRSDLAVARANEVLSDANLRQAKSDGSANAMLMGQYSRTNSSFPQLGLTPTGATTPIQGSFNMFMAGIQVTLPSSNRNQGNIAAASAQIEESKLRREYLEQVIIQEISAAYDRYDAARSSLDIYSKDVLTAAQVNLRVVRQTYEYGRIALVDVLVEQRNVIDLENSYIDALNELYQARVSLQLAIGQESVR